MPEHETTREVFLRAVYDTDVVASSVELLRSMDDVPAEIYVVTRASLTGASSPEGEERDQNADKLPGALRRVALKDAYPSDEDRHAVLDLADHLEVGGLAPPGERDLARLSEIADWIERDRREADKTLCNVSSLRRAIRDMGPSGPGVRWGVRWESASGGPAVDWPDSTCHAAEFTIANAGGLPEYVVSLIRSLDGGETWHPYNDETEAGR